MLIPQADRYSCALPPLFFPKWYPSAFSASEQEHITRRPYAVTTVTDTDILPKTAAVASDARNVETNVPTQVAQIAHVAQTAEVPTPRRMVDVLGTGLKRM